MASKEHLDILNKGVDAWNKWRGQHPEVKPNLINANLSGALLRGADLNKASLMGADLTEADLFHSHLVGANLSGAYLNGAELLGAYLMSANLSGARLIEANLIGAGLNNARLREALLIGASLARAELFRADLSRAILFRASLNDASLVGAYLQETDLREAHLKRSDLSGADLTRADLSGADLTRATLVGTNLTDTILSNCRIYGISVWDVQLAGAEQLNLLITPNSQPDISVDNLKIAQFIYLLLNNKEIRDVINIIGQKAVLILGPFGGGGLEFLHAIAAKLREMNYLPIIFDFERPDNRDFTETIMTLVGLSKFVIADLSGASVPNELRSTIPHFKIPFVPIIEEGKRIYSMFPDLLRYPWVLSPVEFTSQEHLLELLSSRVIEPAEEKFIEVQASIQKLFNQSIVKRPKKSTKQSKQSIQLHKENKDFRDAKGKVSKLNLSKEALIEQSIELFRGQLELKRKERFDNKD